jgi:hypothetical protein
MVIRNALEAFHCEHLSDDQMAELNPIIRDAVYSALWALKHSQDRRGARIFLDLTQQMIPRYWERPELLADLKHLVGSED